MIAAEDIVLIDIDVPQKYTMACGNTKVLIDYSCTCFISEENGEVDFAKEYFSAKGINCFLIRYDKIVEMIIDVRIAAAKEYNKMLISNLMSV